MWGFHIVASSETLQSVNVTNVNLRQYDKKKKTFWVHMREFLTCIP